MKRENGEIRRNGLLYGHGEDTRCIMLEVEVLVREELGAIDACRARAVAVEEIAALDHELSDLIRLSRGLR